MMKRQHAESAHALATKAFQIAFAIRRMDPRKKGGAAAEGPPPREKQRAAETSSPKPEAPSAQPGAASPCESRVLAPRTL